MAQTIDKTVLRRFILGKQGLWPGRRWRGKDGAAAALRAMECLQMDPVSVIARSHDLVLWGRVAEYHPEHLFDLMYRERQFFDYGGWLAIYPMDELPYWRGRMEARKRDEHWADFAAANPALLDALRERIRVSGPVRNRELEGKAINSYRSGKDSGYALYHLWLTGELMTHSRKGIERVYGLLEDIAPAHLQWRADDAAVVEYFRRKAVAQEGVVSERAYRQTVKSVTGQEAGARAIQQCLAAQVEAGELDSLMVEGENEPFYYLAGDAGLMKTLQAGQIPSDWQPLGASTSEEVVFLSPLEYVSARGRARKLFDFDYTWEIYKPASIRKFGPYTLPILYGDRLVGRMDARMDRANAMLVINLFLLEDWFTADDVFIPAAAKGLANLGQFLGARQVDLSALDSGEFRARIEAELKRQSVDV